MRLPKGTTVYHGTGAAFEPHHIESPCWVSTSQAVAEWFVTYHDHYHNDDDDIDPEHRGKRVIEFVTTKSLRLLDVEGRHTFDDIEDRFGFNMQSSEAMAESVCRLGYDGWHIENNYVDGDDTMICDCSVLRFVKLHQIG